MSPPRRGDSCIVTQQLQQNDLSHYNILEGANCLHTHSTETGWNTGMPRTTAKAITEHTACKQNCVKPEKTEGILFVFAILEGIFLSRLMYFRIFKMP